MAIYQNVNYKDTFSYLVEDDTSPKVGFGVKQDRKTFIDAHKKELSLGPQSYEIPTGFQKPRSRRGMPGLANCASRKFNLGLNLENPSPAQYNPTTKPNLKQSYYPFNSSSKRSGLPIKEGPGPTAHNAHKVNLCKRTRFDYNFGHPCMIPAVEMICINYPTENCAKCGNPFEFGDHWHKNYLIYLCNFCMNEEHRLHEMFTEKELFVFKKIRTCSFMHRHEGTSAAVRIKSKHEIKKKLYLENYLSLFMKCYDSGNNTEFKISSKSIP